MLEEMQEIGLAVRARASSAALLPSASVASETVSDEEAQRVHASVHSFMSLLESFCDAHYPPMQATDETGESVRGLMVVLPPLFFPFY